MTFSRQPVAELDRRRALAQQIVDRHSEMDQQCAWAGYIKRLGSMARHHVKTAGSLPEQMAELLEPGELARVHDQIDAAKKVTIEIPQQELDRSAEAWAGGKAPPIDDDRVLIDEGVPE